MRGGGRGEASGAQEAASAGAVPGGRGRAGAVAAGVAGPARRAWGRGPRPPLQLPSVANRLHRSPRRRAAPRAGSGRGWGGSACVCECVRAAAPPPPAPSSVPLVCSGRAALSLVRAASPPPPPPPPFCELESVTGAPVTARPSGTDSSGWKETQQPERRERRGAGTEDARPRAPAREDGRGAGSWLVSREMGDFLK